MPKSQYMFVLFLAFALAGCTTPHQSKQANGGIQPGQALVSYNTPTHKPKFGNTIAVYPKQTALNRPYRVIGKEVVSRYNFIGLERQNKIINDIMQHLAASMGGDAVINVKADNQKIEGTVISYEKVML